MKWVPNDDDGGWDFDAGSVQLSVRPCLEFASGRCSWHVRWNDEGEVDGVASSFESARRHAINAALRVLKADRKTLLEAREV